jgi:hypothetical protein
MKNITSALVLLALAAPSSFAAEPEERNPVTGMTHRETIAAERAEDARRVAAEPAWRPWHNEDARKAAGFPPRLLPGGAPTPPE